MNFVHMNYITPYGDTEKLTVTTSAQLYQGRGNPYLLHNTGTVDVYLNFGGRDVNDATTDMMRLGADEKLTLQIDNMSYIASDSGEIRLTPLADS